jgi:hypothetical protein
MPSSRRSPQVHPAARYGLLPHSTTTARYGHRPNWLILGRRRVDHSPGLGDVSAEPRPYGADDAALKRRGGGVGLLFQPRWTGDRPQQVLSAPREDASFDRGIVVVAALEAVVLGDASCFAELFTDDVVFTSPHLAIE